MIIKNIIPPETEYPSQPFVYWQVGVWKRWHQTLPWGLDIWDLTYQRNVGDRVREKGTEEIDWISSLLSAQIDWSKNFHFLYSLRLLEVSLKVTCLTQFPHHTLSAVVASLSQPWLTVVTSFLLTTEDSLYGNFIIGRKGDFILIKFNSSFLKSSPPPTSSQVYRISSGI